MHKLIKVEIDQNIKYLEIFLNEIKKESKKNETNLGSSMGSLPLPPLNTEMYNKFALLIPSSFNDSEFEKLYDFYRSIDNIKFIYSKMVSKVEESNSIVMRPVGSSESIHTPAEIGYWLYGEDLAELWNEFEEISAKILEIGNPI